MFKNASLDGSLGCTQSSAVTTVATVGTATFLVCYNRVCCPTVKTDCHVASPKECECDGTETFCMRGHVVPDLLSPPLAAPPVPCVSPMPCLEVHNNTTRSYYTAVTTDNGLCAPASGSNLSLVILIGALCGGSGSKAIQLGLGRIGALYHR